VLDSVPAGEAGSELVKLRECHLSGNRELGSGIDYCATTPVKEQIRPK
jgi:hypothetical protein